MNENLNKLFTAIEKHRDLMWDAEKYIWEHPETGFKEWLTHAYLKEQMEEYQRKYMNSDLVLKLDFVDAQTVLTY